MADFIWVYEEFCAIVITVIRSTARMKTENQIYIANLESYASLSFPSIMSGVFQIVTYCKTKIELHFCTCNTHASFFSPQSKDPLDRARYTRFVADMNLQIMAELDFVTCLKLFKIFIPLVLEAKIHTTSPKLDNRKLPGLNILDFSLDFYMVVL